MLYLQENKTKIVKLVVCLALIIGVFCAAAAPVAASDLLKKTVTKPGGVWSGTAKHDSTFVTIKYGCKKFGRFEYKDNCNSLSALSGKHRARIKNSKGMSVGPTKAKGIDSYITKMHSGTVTFQSEYHM